MPNTGIQCPNCRTYAVDRRYSYGNGYLVCNACGYRWN